MVIQVLTLRGNEANPEIIKHYELKINKVATILPKNIYPNFISCMNYCDEP